MKRRTFVQSAAVSVLGLGISSNAAAAPLFQSATGLQHWVRRLITATSAKRRSGALVAKPAFQALTTSLNTYFARHGYVAAYPEFYFYQQQERCCFYSLKLRHARAGLHDMLVAVVSYSPDGAWQHTHTLTGYQIEALARAADALAEHPTLQQLLLPVPRKSGVPAHLGYSSQLADITFKTSLSNGKATTSISIRENESVLFQDTFESKHCLTMQMVNV